MLKNIKPSQAAKVLGIGTRCVQMGLQGNCFPFGVSIPTSNPKIHRYQISPGQLAEYMRISVDELEKRIQGR